MKQQILNVFRIKNRPLTEIEITKSLNLKTQEQKKVVLTNLYELKKYDILVLKAPKIYYLNPKVKMLEGTIQLNTKGFGFIKDLDNQEYFVSQQNLNNALDKDLVTFIVKKINHNGTDNFEAIIIEVLNRKITELVGTVCFDDKNQVKFLKINNIKFQKLVTNVVNIQAAIVGAVVIAKILRISKKRMLYLKITKTIGDINTPGIDILAIAHEFNIKSVFDHATINEAKKVTQKVTQKDFFNRKDLQDQLFITIDGSDAKDLDDAISVKKLENGNYQLFVAIADVSHYIKENSFLDQEAMTRGTSIYLVDRVISMLPLELSAGICSLNEQQQRLVVVCEMEINSDGKNVRSRIYPAVIKTKKRMTYDTVNLIYSKKNSQFAQKNPAIYKMLLVAKELHFILRKYKTRAGFIDFDVNEAKIAVNNFGKVDKIILRKRLIAEMLIEDFMIRANETVAKTISKMKLPCIYRVHDKPKVKKLMATYQVLKTLTKNAAVQKQMQAGNLALILNHLRHDVNFQVVATLLLRSMEKARYDTVNVGHFGLASPCYTHFTSPIRRYPDLVVHRLLWKYLFKKQTNQRDHNQAVALLNKQATQSSNAEVKALECERAVEQMKKAEYMAMQIGQEFNGIISSVTSFGFFVELENTIEGLVRISDLQDDYYHYEETTMRLVGAKTKKSYFLGKKVRILVKNASKLERKIDFILQE